MFFFDEAHLLFNDAPKALLEKIEQVVRLIRSKGVGVYFVTQNPLDIPETVLGQLGNRVQHALRAFTPRDQKAVKTAAETLRPNPKLDAEQVDHRARRWARRWCRFLDEKGTPSIVERAFIVPPGSQHRPDHATTSARQCMQRSASAGHVRKDRRPRIGLREAQGRTRRKSSRRRPPAQSRAAAGNPVSDIIFGKTGPRGGQQSQGILEAMTKSAARSDRLASSAARSCAAYSARSSASGAVERAVVSRLGDSLCRGRRARVLAAPDPDQAFLRGAPGEPEHAALPAHDAVAAVLPRRRLVAAARRAAPRRPRLGGGRWASASSAITRASFLDFVGLQWVGAGVGRLILFLFPTLVLLLSFLFLHKTPDPARDRRARC